MKIVFFIVTLLMLASCTGYDQKASIKRIKQQQEIILKNNGNKNVHALNIKINGHIDGDASIYLMLNKKPYKIKHISGDVDYIWSGDWYDNKAIIIYKPKNVTNGNLHIYYGFRTLY